MTEKTYVIAWHPEIKRITVKPGDFIRDESFGVGATVTKIEKDLIYFKNGPFEDDWPELHVSSRPLEHDWLEHRLSTGEFTHIPANEIKPPRIKETK